MKEYGVWLTFHYVTGDVSEWLHDSDWLVFHTTSEPMAKAQLELSKLRNNNSGMGISIDYEIREFK